MRERKQKQQQRNHQHPAGITVHAFSPLQVKIPSNLELEEVFANLGGDFEVILKKLHLEKAILLCSILTMSKKKRRCEKRRTRYKAITARRLESILTKEKKGLILTALQKGGVLEKSSVNYKTGERSFKYRLCSRYRTGPVKVVEIKNEKLIQKHLSWEESWEKKAITDHEGRSQILKSVAKIKFDANILEEVIAGFPEEKQSECWRNVKLFDAREYWKRLNPSGRLLHRAVFLPKKLREAWYWGEAMETLYEIDVSSCQPTLAATLYKEDCFEKDRYKYVLEKEGFYDFLANRVVAVDEFSEIGRNEIKQNSFVPLFFGSNFSKLAPLQKEIQNAFRAEFPILFERIFQLKSRDYKYLANRLQRLEAKVMIDTVAKGFAHQFPNACLISIHDAFLTTDEQLDVLKVMMETAFEAECGIVPKVKTKMISREKASESLSAA